MSASPTQDPADYPSNLPPGLPVADVDGDHLDGSETADLTGVTATAATGLLALPDFTQEVQRLAASRDMMWSSISPNRFKSGGEIEFLHLSEDGLFIVTIIRAGKKTILEARIDKSEVEVVKHRLADMSDWIEKAENASGKFDKTVVIGGKVLLRWIGDKKGDNDVLEVVRDFGPLKPV